MHDNSKHYENYTYLNYAARYGSIKCFKYLLLNNAAIDSETFNFAIFGGNIEIIRITYQKEEYKKDRWETYIQNSIMTHKNDLFDWLFENKYSNKFDVDLLKNHIYVSGYYGNAHSFIKIVAKGSYVCFTDAFISACVNGFYRLSNIIKNVFLTLNNNIKELFISKSLIFNFDNISIFNLFPQNASDDIDYLLNTAVICNSSIILRLIVDKNKKSFIKIHIKTIKNCFLNATLNTSSDTFMFLINQFNDIFQSLLQKHEFVNSVLDQSCKYGNFDIVKHLIELNLPDGIVKFNNLIFTAIKFERKEIYQYLLTKKQIKYDQYLLHINDFTYLSSSFFSLICNNLPSFIKEIFFKVLLKNTIEHQNYDLFIYLIKEEKTPHDNSLFDAVNSSDSYLVNIILSNDCKPSFINKRSKDGTALNIAVINNNLQIVQNLLSVPGIDADICDFNNKTPLMNTDIYNIEMINLFIDFYGENIHYKNYQLDYLIQRIFENIKSNNFDLKIFVVLDKILEIYHDRIDYYFMSSGFFNEKIIKTNNINLLQNFLNFDVNIISPSTGNSLLIESIEESNAIEIAKILINHQRTNINIQNYENNTALTIAVKNKQIEIIDMLINHEKFDPNKSYLNYSFYLADSEVSKHLLKANLLDVNYAEIITTNIEKDQNEDKFYYMTSLMKSVNEKNIEKIDLIVTHSSFEKDKSSLENAIFITIKNDNVNIYKKLIKLFNYNINKLNYEENKTPLIIASEYHNVEIVKEILKNENFNGNKNEILFSFASCLKINEHSYELISILINYDNEHNKSIDFHKLLPNGKSFFTSIELSSKSDDCYDIDKIIDFLLNKGVDPNQPDNFGIYSLQHALENHKNFALDLLKTEKIDFSVKFDKLKTYLHLATKGDNVEVLDELLNKKVIDVNVKDSLGETPLMDACRSGKSENVKRLFQEKELNFHACNNINKDALQIVFGRNTGQIKDKDDYLQQLLVCLKRFINILSIFINIKYIIKPFKILLIAVSHFIL